MIKKPTTTIDEYLAELPEDKKNELQRIRNIIQSTVPRIKERIAFQYENKK